MVMNARQVAATVMLGMVIVASIVSLPNRAQTPMPARQMGPLKSAPLTSKELPAESVRDLTYN